MHLDELPLALSYQRGKKGLTQKQVADLLNVSDRSVKMWESGASVPRKGVRIRLAQEFGLPPEYFLQDDEIPEQVVLAQPTEAGAKELRNLQGKLESILSYADVPESVKQDLARAIDQTIQKTWKSGY